MAKRYHLTQKDRDFIGRELKKFRGQGKGEAPLPKRQRHIEGDSGASTKNLSAFAIVREEAGASTHSGNGIAGGTVGTCELLNARTMTAIGSQPDPDNNNELGDGHIEFKSLHRVPCPVGSIVILHSNKPIEPFSKWNGQDDEADDDEHGDDRHVWGRLIEVTDYLSELTGFGATKSLYSDGTAPTNIKWGGGQC